MSLLTWAGMLAMGYKRGVSASSGMVYYFCPGVFGVSVRARVFVTVSSSLFRMVSCFCPGALCDVNELNKQLSIHLCCKVNCLAHKCDC